MTLSNQQFEKNDMKLFLLVCLLLIGLCRPESTKRVLILSLDGFRYDYIEKFDKKFDFKNLKSLISTGTRAERLNPIFPPDTFPSHYSMITGLHAESTGIVANSFLDPVFGTYFSLSGSESKNPRWWLGEPLWVTARLQHKITGCVFWPGSEVEIKGTRPHYWQRFNASLSAMDRVNILFSYLDKPLKERPDFMTLYFEDVDHAGHSYGPDDQHVGEAIKDVDNAIGYLLNGLNSRKEDINIIIVSDHGMTNLDPSRRVFLDDYIKEELPNLKFYNFGTLFPQGGPNNQRHVTLEPKDERAYRAIWSKLKNAHPQLNVYDKTDTSFRRFHFKNNRRIGKIVLMTNEGWNIALRTLGGTGTVGGHGHDNRFVNMTGIFIANGPSFKKGYKRGPLDSIHIYELMSNLLKIRPAPNNGTFELIKDVLR